MLLVEQGSIENREQIKSGVVKMSEMIVGCIFGAMIAGVAFLVIAYIVNIFATWLGFRL